MSRMYHSNMDGDEQAGNIARKLHAAISGLTMEAVMCGSKNAVQALMIGTLASSAALHVVAKIAGPQDSENQPLTSTAVLFSALLAYHSAPCEIGKSGRVDSEFSPLVIFDALKDFEKLTGRKPDDDLLTPMCEAAREFASNSDSIARLAMEKAAVFGGSGAIN